MINSANKVWESESTRQLAKALTAISDVPTMQNFLRDAMTESEIVEISARLEAARMLRAGARYTEIIQKTKLSSRTVARIKEWMSEGCGGYAMVLEAIADHGHIPPVRAE